MNKQPAKELLNFIDNSPSPWHAVSTMTKMLQDKGFQRLYEQQAWQLEADGHYYVIRDDSSLIAFSIGSTELAKYGFRIIGAHTDSPGLRIKPNAVQTDRLINRLGVEVYGSPILASFADRDLGIAGRIVTKDIQTHLVHFKKSLVRLPNLAIHMNRGVNQKGLKFDFQKELPLILSIFQKNLPAKKQFSALLADKIGRPVDEISSYELQVFDTQAGNFFGINDEFIANGQLDNLASCHAGIAALLSDSALQSQSSTNLIAYFDHEEIGSQSNKGADGSFLADVLERIGLAMNLDAESQKIAYANSFMISADMTHAYNPNFREFYDDQHPVIVNAGPAIKINSNMRYSSESISQALFARICEQVKVPYQSYVHRSNLLCGSTIGPITAANLGIRSIDIGNPMWAMHSARESSGVLDHYYMIKVMISFFIDSNGIF
jgi:aspartyl aminopeptidase